jgi:sugar-specific transcriptional regulator TrmB
MLVIQKQKKYYKKNNGNLIDALIELESKQKTFTQNVVEVSNELTETIKEIIKKGNVTRIKVKKDSRVLVDIPVNAGVAAGALSLLNPYLLVIGAIAAIATKVSLEIERPNGNVEIINDIIKEKYDEVKDTIQEKVSDIKENTTNLKSDVEEKIEEFAKELNKKKE